ncbi:hypothetical protein HUS23_09025 [Ectothiorhodospiraceae bacterium 2226]|nr:hypothetical protein HUS23_09025 [Ectothiorhodospiraceae bacterium 2226]
MLRTVHAVAGALVFVLLLAFLGTTVVAELLLTEQALVCVKRAIAWAMALYVPLLLLTWASGAALGPADDPVVARKRRRTHLVVVKGVVVLVPLAIFLYLRARAGAVDALFYTVQAAELVVGAANAVLVGLNIRDGVRLRARDRRLGGRA